MIAGAEALEKIHSQVVAALDEDHQREKNADPRARLTAQLSNK